MVRYIHFYCFLSFRWLLYHNTALWGIQFHVVSVPHIHMSHCWYTASSVMLANVHTNETIWHFLKIRYTRRVFVSVGNKFGTFASHFPSSYIYRPFRKCLLNFSERCEYCHLPSIFLSIRKPLVTLARHSKAFATFVCHFKAFLTFAVSHNLQMSYHCCFSF